MKNSSKHILERVYSRQPSSQIISRVNDRINAAQIQQARFRGYGYGLVAVGAFGILIPACNNAYSQITNSGLYEYLSLVVSDSGYVLQHFKTVVMPIAESIPMMSTSLILGTLLLMSYAISKSAVYLKSSRAILANA